MTTQPTNYAIGHNMAGYLPESDVYVVDSFEQAKACLIDDLMYAADSAHQCDELDSADELDNLAQDVNLWSQPETVYSEFRSGLMAWWIVATDEPTSAEIAYVSDLDRAERLANGATS